MRDLEWRAGFRRAIIFMLLYAAILYVLNAVWPNRFGITPEQLPGLLVNAVFFFLLLTVLFSWTEKRRKQRMADLQNRRKGNKPAKASGEEGEEPPEGSLRGQPNPNTSRKKARRRSRR